MVGTLVIYNLDIILSLGITMQFHTSVTFYMTRKKIVKWEHVDLVSPTDTRLYH